MMFMVHAIVVAVVFLQIQGVDSSFFNWNENTNNEIDHKHDDHHHIDGGYMTVDPAKALSLMVNYGGLFIPESVQEEIDILEEIVHVSESKLNIIGKEMELYNISLSLPRSVLLELEEQDEEAKESSLSSALKASLQFMNNEGEKGEEEEKADDNDEDQEALRIDRLYVHWDSYKHTPYVLDVEIEGIYVFVEFYNLMLTHNNWNLLAGMGFPPSLHHDLDAAEKAEEEVEENTSTETAEAEEIVVSLEEEKSSPLPSSIVRLNSIQFFGNMTTHLRSRPLNKDLATLVMEDMDQNVVFEALSDTIYNTSQSNWKETNQLGCTTDQLYDILHDYFTQHITQDVLHVSKQNAQSKLRGAADTLLSAWMTTTSAETSATNANGDSNSHFWKTSWMGKSESDEN